MPQIELSKISHTYNPHKKEPDFALKPFSMTWQNGKRYAILGPSGCGKTTMLNIVSGLIKPTKGKVFFDDLDVTEIKTEDRNVAQVFQFPVIYNTMNVYDNLAFPLKCRKYPKPKIKEKVNEVAKTLNLSSFLHLPARRLTADQKQLISLGRGLVRDDVAAVLMDEPLTVIDPDLKFRLRRNLKEINEQYQTTLIYVTHDQNEAMTFAENIIVMDHGEIVQIGYPKDLFERPKTTFVGYFIGSPAMNLIPSQVISDHQIMFDDVILKVNSQLSHIKNKNVKLGIRSEFIKTVIEQTENIVNVNIERIEDFGNFKLLTTSYRGITIKCKLDRTVEINSGTIQLYIPPDKCCIYSNDHLV